MAKIRLYLDEDLQPLLAHEAVSAIDLGRVAVPDDDRFAYAANERRAILTFHIRDFVPLAAEAMAGGKPFAGPSSANSSGSGSC